MDERFEHEVGTRYFSCDACTSDSDWMEDVLSAGPTESRPLCPACGGPMKELVTEHYLAIIIDGLQKDAARAAETDKRHIAFYQAEADALRAVLADLQSQIAQCGRSGLITMILTETLLAKIRPSQITLARTQADAAKEQK